MSRRSLGSMVLAALIVAASVTPGLAQEHDPGLLLLEPELRNGTWFGTGIVDGTAEFEMDGGSQGDLELFLDLVMYGNFFFDVATDGTVTGEWDIVEPSSGTIDLHTADFYAGTLDATYSGSGQVTGDRRRIEANGTITQVGVLSGPGISGDIQANSTDELPSTIVAEITTAFCNEASGQWELSWEQVLQSVGWEPSFSGEWVAVRQSAEFEEEIEDGHLERMATQVAEAITSWGNVVTELRTRDWSTPLNSSEWNAVIDRFEEFEHIQNELRNLTPCDRDTLGEDQIERWETAMADGMLAVIEAAAVSGDLYGSDIADLVGMGLRAGAFGEGNGSSELRSEAAEQLRLEAEDIVNEHYEVGSDEQGKHFEPVPGANESEELFWAVDAGVRMGWTFTLTGDGASGQVAATDMMASNG